MKRLQNVNRNNEESKYTYFSVNNATASFFVNTNVACFRLVNLPKQITAPRGLKKGSDVLNEIIVSQYKKHQN